jgi:protein-disulfide isomerase
VRCLHGQAELCFTALHYRSSSVTIKYELLSASKFHMIKKLLPACALLLLCSFALAQDPALLRPPKGAPVALIVFEDLECPKCRVDSPLEEQAAKAHKIPLVRHDFPLPMHKWSFNAAVIARYFDSQSKDLGNQFRDYIFQHQPEITADNLQSFAQKFASDHKVELPFVIDTQGKFAAEVNADKALGQKVGIQHTPTIYIVSSRNRGRPVVEVTDSSQLFQMIEAVQAE